MFHLPDLPTAGYATQRQREGTDAIMFFMRDVERNRLRLLTIVAEGLDKWRTVARSVFGYSLAIDNDALDEMYRYFTLQAVRPAMQQAMLAAITVNDVDRYKALYREAMPDVEAQLASVRLIGR